MKHEVLMAVNVKNAVITGRIKSNTSLMCYC